MEYFPVSTAFTQKMKKAHGSMEFPQLAVNPLKKDWADSQ